MKKRMLTLTLVALLTLSLGGAAQAFAPEATEAPSPVTQEIPMCIPGDMPALTDVQEAMTPALHGMLLSVLSNGQPAFDLHDRVQCWEALYNMLSLYGQMDERAEYVGEELVIPSEVLVDFAAVLTDDVAALVQLPDEVSDRITYDAPQDCYRLVCGNDELAELTITAADSTTLSGELVYVVDGTVLAQFTAVLQPADNLFGYAVASFELN